VNFCGLVVQKGKFSPATLKFAFLPALKRQNRRPLQASLARLSIATKRQITNKVAYEIRVPKEGNQLKRLNTSLRPPGT